MSAKSTKVLPVVYALEALQELDAIWDWNEKTYSRSHAANYIDHLERHIEDLGRHYVQGKPVGVHPHWRYILIRRKSKSHGHLAVYRYDDKQVNVLHVFHTAQDWQAALAAEGPDE